MSLPMFRLRPLNQATRHCRQVTMKAAKPVVVLAVDGPAGAGKGTLATRLAEVLRVPYLDTGLLYRAVAVKALQAGLKMSDEQGIASLAAQLSVADVQPNEEQFKLLRAETTGSAASQVSVHKAVRAAVGTFPRHFANTLPQGMPGCVMDGRDVGTALFPDAPLKLYIIASAEVRAQRRLSELQARGDSSTTLEEILRAVQERDERDSTRAVAPLLPAADAHIIDTSNLTADQVLQMALALAREKLPCYFFSRGAVAVCATAQVPA